MKVIDKITKRCYSACPVIGGYQVCTTPDVAWEDAKLSDIHVFLNEQFESRFELA